MTMGFLASQDSMYHEIEQWVARGRLDTLISLCNCCVYKVFDLILTPKCRMCIIRKGIVLITNERRKTDAKSCAPSSGETVDTFS